MILSLLRVSCLGIALFALRPVIAQPPEEATTQDPPVTETRQEMPPDGQPPGGLPEGYQEELDKRVASFRAERDKLQRVMIEQQEVYIRYANHEDRSPAAKQRYIERREKSLEQLDATYEAALYVTRWGFDEEAATYLVTMIQHRNILGIYDAPTLEGATRLIDAGSKFLYLFQAAARSAVVVGDFELAKRLYEVIEDDQKEDLDRTLEFNLPKYQEQFETEQAIRQEEAEQDDLPRVLLKTTQGDIVLELFLKQAPSTVSNFISLVEEGFYEGLDFYQVIEHVLAITGDPSGVGTGNSGQFLIDEHGREDSRKALRGSLIMAKIPMGEQGNFIPNSASSQFAILFMPMLAATEAQTVFGRVAEGMDVVSRLQRIDPNKEKKKGEVMSPPDHIIEATVLRRPDSLPEPAYVDLGRR